MIEKFKSGDRVIIKSKSWWSSLDSSIIYKKGKERGYWYFQYYTGENSVCVVDDKIDENDGDYFLESDLELYIEKIMEDLKIEEFEI